MFNCGTQVKSTKNFTQSEIHTVIPLLRKILCDKSVWNGFGPQGDPGGVKYRDVFHQSSPPGEKYVLAFYHL
jgi:hypothetical protein